MGSMTGVAVAPSTSAGRIEPSVIQQIVRDDFVEMQKCYEEGLRRDPKLQGRVVVKFVIGMRGNVVEAADARDEPRSSGAERAPRMTDTQVVACVVARFTGLVFPRPEGGPVTVFYPLVFSPAD